MSEKKDALVSLVIPVFNEEQNISHLYPNLIAYLDRQKWDYELVYVNDGSHDGSLEIIQEIHSKNRKVHFVSFSRNFGKEAATSAGIRKAKGDAVIMFDADGQFPIDLIGKFVESWLQGYEVVIGVRTSNQREGWIKKHGSRVFNWLLSPLSAGNSVPGATDFRLIDRKVADKFNELTEHTRITRGLIDWLGYKRTYITFGANARMNGKAGYTVRKLVRLALYAFVSQSTKPLLFTGALGLVVVAVSFVAGAFMVVEEYLMHDPLHLGVTGTAILAVLLSFLVGIVLICQGLLALYIESIHRETQNRPLYVVSRED